MTDPLAGSNPLRWWGLRDVGFAETLLSPPKERRIDEILAEMIRIRNNRHWWWVKRTKAARVMVRSEAAEKMRAGGDNGA